MNKVLAEKLTKAVKDKKDREEIAIKSKIYINHLPESLTPSERGESFHCHSFVLNFDGDIELAEAELCLGFKMEWSLLDYSTV